MTLNMAGLQVFRAGLADAVDDGVAQAAEYVRDLAEQLAPEDEGDLKETVRVLPKEQDGVRFVAAGGISGSNKFVDYAVFVEYGTSNENYPAQPFMTPAAEQIDVDLEIAKTLKELERRCAV